MDQTENAYHNLLIEKKEKLKNENLIITSKQQLVHERNKQNHEDLFNKRLEILYNKKLMKERKSQEGKEDLGYLKELKQKKHEKILENQRELRKDHEKRIMRLDKEYKFQGKALVKRENGLKEYTIIKKAIEGLRKHDQMENLSREMKMSKIQKMETVNKIKDGIRRIDHLRLNSIQLGVSNPLIV